MNEESYKEKWQKAIAHNKEQSKRISELEHQLDAALDTVYRLKADDRRELKSAILDLLGS